MNNQNLNFKRTRAGFTLIEILVVIGLLVIVTALVVPRIRTVSKDRNIRETARVVGSFLSSASQRAQTNGIAGVEFVRNTNFEDPSNFAAGGFACTQMFTLRSIPDFTGDDETDRAGVMPETFNGIPAARVFIRIPLEHTAADPIFEIGDKIRFNHRTTDYEILTTPTPNGSGFLSFVISNQGVYPYPAFTFNTFPTVWDATTTYNAGDVVTQDFGFFRSRNGSNVNNDPVPSPGTVSPGWERVGYEFRVERRPIRMDSSLVNLPAGYYIDLRYSDSGNGLLHPDATSLLNTQNSIEVVFNGNGGIENVTGAPVVAGAPQPVFRQPSRDLKLLIVEDNINLEPTEDNLDQETNLWVTVRRSTGAVGINYNFPPIGATGIDNRLRAARVTTNIGAQAAQ